MGITRSNRHGCPNKLTWIYQELQESNLAFLASNTGREARHSSAIFDSQIVDQCALISEASTQAGCSVIFP